MPQPGAGSDHRALSGGGLSDSGTGVGGVFRARRREAGLTQAELARRAAVGLGTIRDLEQDRTRRPSAESVGRLARALGLDPGAGGALALSLRQPRRAGGDGRRRGGRKAGTSRLWVQVLGPLEVWRLGKPVSLDGVKQRVLLGVLALAANTVVHRETLIDVLWGEEPPATAVSLLQGYVGRLRQILDPGRSARDPAGMLVTVGAGYRLQVSRRQLDLVAFAELAGKASAACSRGAAEDVCGAYEQALGIWRGQVLAGIDALKNHPAVIEVNRRRADVICDYADAAGDAGWHGRALAHLWDLAGREPLDEKVHARLMIALAATGQQAAALKVYEDLRHRLDDQLGVGPGAELAAAHLRVLRQQVPAAAPVHAPPSGRTAGPGTVPVVPRQLPAAVAHFVGRAAEMEILNGLLDQAAAGNRAVVISAIGGTAGVGKTALALHWAHQVAAGFPDGQLYVNLRGFDPCGLPVSPVEAISGFLDALGVPPAEVPPSPLAQAGLYRNLLAERCMLILLDNARDAEQVRPLLPAAPGCLVLVTSRSQLTGLAVTARRPPAHLGPAERGGGHQPAGPAARHGWQLTRPRCATSPGCVRGCRLRCR